MKLFLNKKYVLLVSLLVSLSLIGILSSPSDALSQNFANSGYSLSGLYGGNAVWADIDNDGDPDIIISGSAQDGTPSTLIYENLAGAFNEIDHDVPGVYHGGVYPADYDNDGDFDLFVLGLSTDDAVIAEIWNNDGGTFVKDTEQDMVPLRFASAEWADINSDGLLDLVTVGTDEYGMPRTILYKNKKLAGISNFELQIDQSQSFLNVTKGDASLSDYDSDGDLDMVVAGVDATGYPNATFYLNDGDGFFSIDNLNSPLLVKLASTTLSLGDIDADGFPELIQMGYNTKWETVTKIYENQHNGRFSVLDLPEITQIAGNATWADFNGDGKFDLALSGNDKNSNLFGNILTNNGDESFTEFTLLFHKLNLGGISAADYNADSKPDLLLTGVDAAGDYKTLVYMNVSAGSFVSPQAPFSMNEALVTNDKVILSWDNGTDAVSPTPNISYNLRIGLVGQENRVFSGITPFGPGNLSTKISKELNLQLGQGDYVWSIQSVNAQLNRSAWSTQQEFSVGQFVSSLQKVEGFQFAASAWGDYDNDGDQDLVISGSDANAQNRTILYVNHEGVLAEDREVNNNLVKVNYGAFDWGDYDNDGDLDLAYSGFFIRESATSGIYRNDNGVLTDLQGIIVEVGYSSMDWGDYDSDGDLDLVVMGKTSEGPFVTKLYDNNNGTLTEAAVQPFEGYSNGRVKWVTYSDDGYLDLSITGQSANGDNLVRLYKNTVFDEVTGEDFQEDTENVLPSFQSSTLDWADLDDDGDLDMIVTGYYENSTAKTIVYTNEAGVLAENTAYDENLVGVIGGSITLGDYDNDGDPDLVISGFDFNEPVLKVYKNTNGSFIEDEITLLNGKGVDFSTISLVDIDSDADLDLVTTGRQKFDAATFNAATVVYDNVSSRNNPNLDPLIIEGLKTTGGNGNKILMWDQGQDQPIGDPNRDFVFYQVRVGTTPGGNDIISGAQVIDIGKYNSIRLYPVMGLASGDYYWSVRAVDNGYGVSEWADEATFRVDITAPTVLAENISVTPDSAGFGTVTLLMTPTENFDLDYEVNPLVIAEFSNGNTALFSKTSYVGGTWIGELNILESYPSGAATISVEGVTDAAGNVMDAVSNVGSFFVDTDRPGVISTYPASEEIGVKTSITLTAELSEAIDISSVDNNVMKLFLGSQEITPASEVSVSSNGKILSVLFSGLEGDTIYRAAVVSTLTDIVGNSLAGDYTWQFTTAKIVSVTEGGDISNGNGMVSLNIPPNAVSSDVELVIERVDLLSFPDNTSVYADVAYMIGPEEGLSLNKSAAIEISYADADLAAANIARASNGTSLAKSAAVIDENKLTVYMLYGGSWERIGGTLDAVTNKILFSTTKLGVFALFEDSETGTSDEITELDFSPRVFAPNGTRFLADKTNISFNLGRQMDVTILAFNTSGRLVRAIMQTQSLGMGRQTVVWDGKDHNGKILPSGLYTIIVKSGGKDIIKTVAISNK